MIKSILVECYTMFLYTLNWLTSSFDNSLKGTIDFSYANFSIAQSSEFIITWSIIMVLIMVEFLEISYFHLYDSFPILYSAHAPIIITIKRCCHNFPRSTKHSAEKFESLHNQMKNSFTLNSNLCCKTFRWTEEVILIVLVVKDTQWFW